MANSHGKGVRSDTSSTLDHTTFLTTSENHHDADLDLVQCSSPSSANADPSPLQGARNLNSPIHLSSPVNSYSPIPGTGASEHRLENSVSPQNNHPIRTAMHISDDLRKTALTNSQHHASGTIVTRNRYGRLLTLDLTPAVHAYPDVAEDLYDWLELTGWHDVTGRIREIDRYRELEALEKQQATIQSKKEQLLRSYGQESTGLCGNPKTIETSSSIVSSTYNSPSAQHRRDMFQDATMTEVDRNTRTRLDNPHYPKGPKQEDEHITSSKLPGTFRPQLSLTRSSRGRSASPRAFKKNDQYDYSAYRKRKGEPSRPRAEERNRPSSASINGSSHRPYEDRITTRPEGRENGRRPEVSAEHRQYSEAPEGWDRDRRRDRDDVVPMRDLERERMNIGYYKHIDIKSKFPSLFFLGNMQTPASSS
ncbi:hypothetical protein F4809DRAFT_636490 [Biscogniauxia mediterranea]|nr:hypothetical protein F4809DRAFT_636490 [Biscogniauxia mediterranea]